jgi:hypothetical protein
MAYRSPTRLRDFRLTRLVIDDGIRILQRQETIKCTCVIANAKLSKVKAARINKIFPGGCHKHSCTAIENALTCIDLAWGYARVFIREHKLS